MHQGKRFSNPFGNGPGRILYCIRPFGEPNIPDNLLHIHQKAATTAENRRVTGQIEQYNYYHELIVQELPALMQELSDAIAVFVPTLTVDLPVYWNEERYTLPVIKDRPVPSIKRGVDITSNYSYVGREILEMHKRIIQYVSMQDTGSYPDSQPGKKLIYIPVAPVLTLVHYDGNTLRNMLEDIVEDVSGMMSHRDKELMGSTALTNGFEKPFYEYMASFYDADRALMAFHVPDLMTKTQYRKELLDHTRYNRIVTAHMYGKIMSLIPEREIYAYIAKTSPLHSILEYAAKSAGKEFHEVTIMRNTKLPALGEAEKSPFGILENYLITKLLGRRAQLVMKDLF
jgi:hypothetical protein